MAIWDRLLCYFGMHIRSRRKAKRSQAGWHSVCRSCGHPMMKLKGGDWRIMDRAQPARKDERVKLRKAEARHKRMPPPRRRKKGAPPVPPRPEGEE